MFHTLYQIPQVAVILPSSVKICRDIRRGILKYVRRHGQWGLHILEGRDGEQKLIKMKEWGCTGIIIRPGNPEFDHFVLKADLPTVLVEDPKGFFIKKFPPRSSRCVIRSETEAIGRVAASYFIDRDFKNFAYVGEIHGMEWSVKRGNAFVETVKRAGFSCYRYGALEDGEDDAGMERDLLCEWLRNLPKPIALLAAMDNRAHQVIGACNWAGIGVPQEIAVLGVDNDNDLCENAYPPMSSILLGAEKASYDAAAYLDKMMRKQEKSYRVFTYGPSHVVSRQSTRISNSNDPIVSRALEFIRANALSPIDVPQVVKRAHASRRLVEMRFRKKLGHSILNEIRNVRLEHVCALLRESDKSIGDITAECGFESESYLGVIFRKKYGRTMRDFRKGE